MFLFRKNEYKISFNKFLTVDSAASTSNWCYNVLQNMKYVFDLES